MIVLDIESSGLDCGKCGIWQIGALDLKSGNTFLQEARLDEGDEITEEALMITGKTKMDLLDNNQQSQKQLINNFLDWVKDFKERVIAGHNVGWDMSFIQNKCFKYGLHDKFMKIIGYRAIDLHTLAMLKYKEKHGKFKLREEKSGMNLPTVLEFCGMKDTRMSIRNHKIVKEGKPHNALEDCKLEAECFRRLLK